MTNTNKAEKLAAEILAEMKSHGLSPGQMRDVLSLVRKRLENRPMRPGSGGGWRSYNSDIP